MSLRTSALILAGLAACAADPELSSTQGDVTDVYAVRTPMYTVSMTVFTDWTANASTPLHKDEYGGGFGPADQLRVGLQAYRLPSGTGARLQPVSDSVSCYVGDMRDRGLLPPAVLTQPGGRYSSCALSPEVPARQGMPIELGAPVELGADDNLYVYARLEVMNSGEPVIPNADPDAGVAGALKNLGGAFERAGEIVGIVPGADDVSNVGQAIGGILKTIGEVATSDQRSAASACAVSNSLIPGWGNGQAPSDKPSPLLQAAMTGSELWAKTAGGDAVLEYSLDWGDYAQTRLCSRPKTRVQFRVRRVVGEGNPGDPVFARGGVISAADPGALDAYSVDASKTIVHDQWRNGAWFRSTESLPNTSFQTTCGHWGCFGGYYPVFPARGHIVAVGKASGQQDIFGISAQGKLVDNWRNQDFDGNAWHAWDTRSGAYFPPGAPVAVVARRPGHIDVFAIANDGSMMTTSWDDVTGWAPDATRITATGMFMPWNGTNGGGVAAVSTGIDPYWRIEVYAAGVSYELVQMKLMLFSNSWSVTDNFALQPPDVWYTPGSNFVALSRNPDRVDLLFVDAYGHGRALWSDNGWRTQQITPDAMPLVRGGEVAAVARKIDVTLDPLLDDDHMDFFSVGTDGAIAHSTWVARQNPAAWFVAYADRIPGIVAQSGAPIGAVAPHAGTIQVAAAKGDGSLAHAWFQNTDASGVRWATAP